MTERQFDAALKNGFTSPEPTYAIDSKIERALESFQAKKTLRKRIGWTAWATVTCGGVLWIFPAVQAQAAIVGMQRALDSVVHAKVTTYTVSEDGTQTPTASTIIVGEDIFFSDMGGDREIITKGSKSYSLDRRLKAYIVSDRRPNSSLRLRDMLSPTGGFGVNKRLEMSRDTIDGVEYVKATIINGGFPERYNVWADPKTDLPFKMTIESKERESWRLRQALAFDYASAVQVPSPDTSKFKVMTQALADSQFEASMEASQIAEIPLKKGRLVIRDVQVAQDGTVFVAYQVGDRRAHTWSGYALSLRDNLGTKYLRCGEFSSEMEGPFQTKDGKLEMEVFVPTESIPSTSNRVLTITTNISKERQFIRTIRSEVDYPDGTRRLRWSPNRMGGEVEPISKATVVERAFHSTCFWFPDWAAKLNNMEHGNEIWSQMSRAGCRAKAAMESSNWAEAKFQLNEQLRLMLESEQKGYGTWARNAALTQLDEVNRHLANP